MKKILAFSFLFALFASALHSQINEGSVLLGGNVGFSTNEAKDTSLKNNSVSISPVAGIAVKQNLVVGISFSYGHNKNNLNAPGAQVEGESFGVGIFARKYITLGKGFYLLAKLALIILVFLILTHIVHKRLN